MIPTFGRRWWHWLLGVVALAAKIDEIRNPSEVQQAAFLTMFLIALALTAVSILLRPKPDDAKAADLGEFDFPTATEGRPVPLVWGTVKLSGPNVIWYGDYRSSEITQDVSLAPDPVVGHRYALGVQMALCRGQLDALRRIWVGDKLFYDGITPSPPAGDGTAIEFAGLDYIGFYGGDEVGGNGGVTGRLRFYDGRSTQTAEDSYLAGFQNPVAPGYIGTAHCVWEGPSEGELTYIFQAPGGFNAAITSPVGYLGNSPQIDKWAFEVQRFPNTLGIPAGKHIVNTFDANPVAVLYEVLTDTDWGMGLPGASIDTANFLTAASTVYDEGNGFSWVLDKEMDGDALLEEIERHIDGHVYINRVTGQYEIVLIRGGYTIAALPLLDESNVLRVEDYKEQQWEDTENILRVRFTTRDSKAEDYKTTYALAQDMGNIQNQSINKPATVKFPGCKDFAQASVLATRELRQLTTPKKSASLVCNQSLYATNPGDVLRWTNTKRGITDLPVRVTKITPGSPEDGEVILSVVEDVFRLDPAIFASAGDTGWTPPSVTLLAIPTDEDIVLDIPRMLALRDTAQPGAIDRIWCGARYQNDSASGVRVYQRNASGTPSGSYTLEDYSIGSFLKIGQLNATLDQDTTNPTTITTEDIRVDDTPDDVIGKLTLGATDAQLGQNLTNLVLIEDEFLLASTYVDGSGFLSLSDVYRGVGDTVATSHAAGTDVFVVVGVPGSTVIPRGNNVDVQLASFYGTFQEIASPNTVSITMNDRARRPYPPHDLTIETVRYPTTSQDLDATTATGSGDDQVGFDAAWTRRDYRTYDERTNSTGTVQSGFPSDDSHENRVKVYDTTGAPVLVYTGGWAEQAGDVVTRTDILAGTDGIMPDSIRVDIETRHTFEAEVFEALQVESWEFDVESTLLDPLSPTSAEDENVESASFEAAETGIYTFKLTGTGILSTGKLEARINAGTWVDVITTGNASGTLTGVSATDDVTWRHTQATGGVNALLLIEAPSTADEAFGILKT